MLTQTSDTWWHFLHHSTRSALCHTARTATSNGVVLQRLLRTLEAGEVLPWGDGDGTVFSNSGIGIAVLIFKFIKLVYLLSHVHFNLNTFGHFCSFPRLGRESVWSAKPFSIKTLQQHTCHGPQVKYFPETERQRHRHLSRNLQKSWNLNPSRTESIDACELVWLQCFPSITNDCSRTQRSFEDTLEGSRALSSWITLLTNLVVAPGSSQENFRKICNIFCNTAFFEKSNIFPKKTKL